MIANLFEVKIKEVMVEIRIIPLLSFYLCGKNKIALPKAEKLIHIKLCTLFLFAVKRKYLCG
jgi:hypothetical protein